MVLLGEVEGPFGGGRVETDGVGVCLLMSRNVGVLPKERRQGVGLCCTCNVEKVEIHEP